MSGKAKRLQDRQGKSILTRVDLSKDQVLKWWNLSNKSALHGSLCIFFEDGYRLR